MKPGLLASTGSAVLVLACLAATPLGAREQGRAGHPRSPQGESARPRPAPEPRPAQPPAPATAPAPGAPSGNGEGDRAVARGGGRPASEGSPGASEPGRRRSREAPPQVGTAVRRESVPPPDPGVTLIVPRYSYGFYPWGFGGLGFDGYHGYGGYDGYYDPAYGGYPRYGVYPYYDRGGGFSPGYDGSLHLKMKPRGAQVYVDGYYAGIVDDFDGVFQRLHLDAGPHRIEVRAPGHEPLMLDVRIDRDRTTIYRGDLEPIR